jgi:hypothetical protein
MRVQAVVRVLRQCLNTSARRLMSMTCRIARRVVRPRVPVPSTAVYVDDHMRSALAREVPVQRCTIKPSRRLKLVKWLVDLTREQKLRPDTLHCAVQLLDRLGAVEEIPKAKLQVVAAACLLVSSKMTDVVPIDSGDLVCMADGCFGPSELRTTERRVLRRLDYETARPTALTFLQIVLSDRRASVAVRRRALQLLDATLLDHRVLRVPSRVVAIAAVDAADQLVSGVSGVAARGWPASMYSEMAVTRSRVACAETRALVG